MSRTDLKVVKDLNELSKEERRLVLRDKFNLHFPKTSFGARKNQEYNQ